MPPTAFRRDRFTWLAYLLLAFFAYFLNVLGPSTPFLKAELDLSYTIASLYFSALAAGTLLVNVEFQNTRTRPPGYRCSTSLTL